MLLRYEHVLDSRTHGGALRIGPGYALRHCLPTRLLPVDVADEHTLGEEGLVLLRTIEFATVIGPDIGRRPVRDEQVGQGLKHPGFSGGGII